ncbi:MULTISPECIES: hypothetical protein [unclassified Dehalobacter]|uniref:hypothetical protein n=1 Tax=unclassified Dehalobacter TaxID=2635733 RepID=UPI000E6C73DD|nr:MULTISPECIES: hypothetical protein [unclassified Dehalobacter]RJE47448.1 hypothetical protein A7K50_02015 [Dehalobacter sp. MCB1]TCX48740.1 hypothetical protein C1I36_11685 [Dehalobacter sp. 14DCB1]TCX56212.1 hypothetical protein C1I38_01505 [Dehalobacter sp. 12DCB1]
MSGKKTLLCLFISLIIIALSGSSAGIASNMKAQNNPDKDLVLLLHSGLASCQNARVKYIIWTEDSNSQKEIESILQSSDLLWNKTVLSDFANRTAYRYSAELEIDQDQEINALNTYEVLGLQLSGPETKVYLEESVDQEIDIQRYFKMNTISIIQKTDIPSLYALSGYTQGLGQGVKAGKDTINIQTVTRKYEDNRGRTVLALPALLEEV